MITEDYVSFEVAKLLKEKGFDIPTMFVWYEHTPYITSRNAHNKPSMDFIYLTDSPDDERFIKFSNNDKIPEYISGNVYSCPTHQMAIKWLREVHKLHIDIWPTYNMETEEHTGWGITVSDLSDFGGAYLGDAGSYKTYEEAVEVALKTSLENFI